MQPPPAGVWGMPREMLRPLPGYNPDVVKNRPKAARSWRSSATVLISGCQSRIDTQSGALSRSGGDRIDQLKEVYIDGELNPIDTTQWYPMLLRKDYKVAVNITETEVDDPDPVMHENYVCGANATTPAIAILRSTSWSNGSRWNPTSENASGWCGRSRQAGRGRRPPNHVLPAERQLLAASPARADDDGQQHLQFLALRRRLARPVTASCTAGRQQRDRKSIPSPVPLI